MGKIDLETRKRTCLHVRRKDLVDGFRRVGVQPGDMLYCHSSLSRFGYVRGGADAVVDALVEAVGPGGTVAMPAGTYSLGRDGGVFDVWGSPSELGAVTEALRKRAPCRSHHLTESVCAVGKLAEELTLTHSVTPCGTESPFRKFIERDAQILLLGVPHKTIPRTHSPRPARSRDGVLNSFLDLRRGNANKKYDWEVSPDDR